MTLFVKLQYLIEDKSLIDLGKCVKNSNGSVLSSIDWTLGIGDTLAIFQAAGKILFEIKLLIICVSRETMYSIAIFSSRTISSHVLKLFQHLTIGDKVE